MSEIKDINGQVVPFSSIESAEALVEPFFAQIEAEDEDEALMLSYAEQRMSLGHNHNSIVDYEEVSTAIDKVQTKIQDLLINDQGITPDYEALCIEQDMLAKKIRIHTLKQELDLLAAQIQGTEYQQNKAQETLKKLRVSRYLQLVAEFDNHPDSVKIVYGTNEILGNNLE